MKKFLTGLFVAACLAIVCGPAVADLVIGVNFCDSWPKPQLAGKTADGFSNWTDSYADGRQETGSGLVLLGSGDAVTCDWTAANTWAAGQENTEEQQLYRVYLDDGGDGAQVTFSGLADWLAAEGAPAYTVRVYQSTDSAIGFAPVSLYEGDDLLTTVQNTNMWTDDGGYRAWVDTGQFAADAIKVTSVRDGDSRATIAAVKITAVPEPATMLLLGLGALALRRKRA